MKKKYQELSDLELETVAGGKGHRDPNPNPNPPRRRSGGGSGGGGFQRRPELTLDPFENL